MTIIVNLSKYFDWVKTESKPSEADFQALKAKVGQTGEYLLREIMTGPTYTQVNLNEVEIQDCMAHFARIGSPKSRAKTVAWYLEEKVMPHHAAVEHYTSIQVEGEPEVEKFLNRYFDTEAK